MFPEMHIWDNQLRIELSRMQLRCEYDYLIYHAINEDMSKEIKRILR